MTINITVPHDLERRSLQDRCRWWAEQYMKVPHPNLRVVELLREAAVEVDLGRRTDLTFRGR